MSIHGLLSRGSSWEELENDAISVLINVLFIIHDTIDYRVRSGIIVM
jgi:hypothetical protein